MYILTWFKSNLDLFADIKAVIIKNWLCLMLDFVLHLLEITRKGDVVGSFPIENFSCTIRQTHFYIADVILHSVHCRLIWFSKKICFKNIGWSLSIITGNHKILYFDLYSINFVLKVFLQFKNRKLTQGMKLVLQHSILSETHCQFENYNLHLVNTLYIP